MRNLSDKLLEKYYYISNNTVYDVKYGNKGDCAKKGVSAITDAQTQVLIPCITVKKGNKTEKLFLDNLIDIGDTYDSSTSKFTKNQCKYSGKTLSEFYESECEDVIKEKIESNPSRTYALFNDVKSSLGIPLYMIKGAGYTITGATPIEFTEEYFDGLKKDVVEKQMKLVAEAKANEYGYEIDQLTAKKK